MKVILNFAISTLLLISAASLLAETPDSGTSAPADYSTPAEPGSGSGTVAATIEVDNYTYLRLAESDTWVAVSNKDVAIGDEVK